MRIASHGPPSILVFAIGIAACASPGAGTAIMAPASTASAASTEAAGPPAPPASAAESVSASLLLRTDPFGGARWGFVEATSANGRFVALRRFAGDARPAFGHHGESGTPTDVVVFDRVDGSERNVGEIIDVDPTRRFFLVVESAHVFLADASTGKYAPLTGIDTSADGNACLPPRQAAFSTGGGRAAWVVGDTLRVRDLATGEEWAVASKGRLWRGWADDTGRGAVLAEVPRASTGWPSQHTSCACRWCGRFAMSFGVYGWGGPTFTVEHVAEDGTRSPGDAPKGHSWDGPTDAGCTIVAESTSDALDRGPWRSKCGG